MFTLDEGEDVASILALHVALLDRLQREHGQVAVVIHGVQIRDALRYANRNFSAASYALGKLNEPPPTPVWPMEPETIDDSVMCDQDACVSAESRELNVG